MATTTAAPQRKPRALAKGPALLLGVVLQAAGLYFIYKQPTFEPFSNFPSHAVHVPGKAFFGIFGVNGWTGMFTAVCGAVLLFGAAQRVLAKTMSLIVGVALAAAAVLSLITGNVAGMAAATVWTKVGWGACAVILLVNTGLPSRARRRRPAAPPPVGPPPALAPSREPDADAPTAVHAPADPPTEQSGAEADRSATTRSWFDDPPTRRQ